MPKPSKASTTKRPLPKPAELRGRRKPKATERHSDILRFTLTTRQKSSVKKAASLAGYKEFSVWSRAVVLAAAKELIDASK